MSRKRVKQYLTLLMAIGVIAIVAGGSGTFASFNAEVSHTGNTYATGTLLLHSTSGSTTCASESNSGNLNTTSPTGCAVLFNNVSIGVPGSGTLAAAVSNSGAVTSLSVSSLSADVEIGDTIKLTNGSSNTDTFTATKAVAAGSSVTIPVISKTPTNSYAIGDAVAVQTYTQYADIQLKNAGTLDAKDIKFQVPSCTNSAAQTLTLGTTTASSLTGAVTSIAISASAYGAASGGSVTITNASSQSETLTLSAQVNPGDTSISVNSATLSNTYASGSTIKYSPFISGSGTLCGNLNYVIVETDSSYHHDSSNAAQKCSYGTADSSGIGCIFSSSKNLGAGPTSDTALDISNATTGTGTANTAGELDNGQSRYFVLGIQTDVSSLTNSSQNQKATFSVKWHIDQK